MDDHFPLLALHEEHLVITRIVEQMHQRTERLVAETEEADTEGAYARACLQFFLNLQALRMLLVALFPKEIQASIAAEQTRFEEETATWE